jgi:formylmethanofuran dehydrogenase subunit E
MKELVCDHCGCVINPEEDDYQEIDGEIWCQECIDTELAFCDDCEEYVPQDEIHEVDGNFVCDR